VLGGLDAWAYVAEDTEAPMPICPSCNQQSSDPGALFCPYCGFALPDGEDRDVGVETLAVGLAPPYG